MYFFGKFGKLSLKHMQKRLETQPPPPKYILIIVKHIGYLADSPNHYL